MSSLPVNDHARRFLVAVPGINARRVAAALSSMPCSATLPLGSRRCWGGCSKGAMAREYGAAMKQRSSEADAACSTHLRQLDLATLAQRAQACADGRADWAGMTAQGREATMPAPTTAEIAAAVVKAPVPSTLHQEVHEMPRCLLRTDNRLCAAGQRLKGAQEHHDALLALVGQAAVVPGGLSEHQFDCPGGWLERARRVLAAPPQV